MTTHAGVLALLPVKKYTVVPVAAGSAAVMASILREEHGVYVFALGRALDQVAIYPGKMLESVVTPRDEGAWKAEDATVRYMLNMRPVPGVLRLVAGALLDNADRRRVLAEVAPSARGEVWRGYIGALMRLAGGRQRVLNELAAQAKRARSHYQSLAQVGV